MLGPYARKPFEPSFVKERMQFVAKQPGREGDDAADEVVARPAGVVLPVDDAFGLRPGAHRHLRRAAVRQGGAGADDRELHVAAREVRPAPRRVVELLRPERCLVAADVAEAALDGPCEPVHERGGSTGLRCPRADVVRVVDALLLVSWRWPCSGSWRAFG